MKNYTYHKEVETLLTQFVTVLNGAIVKRIDETGTLQSTIAVKYMYMPKGRIIHDLINTEQNITLPIVSVSLSSMIRAPERQINKHFGPLEYSSTSGIKTLQPIPIDLNVNISGICKYQNDVDQIISNFVPYFDPYVIITWTIPDTNIQLNNKIEWNGNIIYNYPTEITSKSKYRVGFDTSFKIEGWMYKDYSVNPVKIILPENLGGGVYVNFYAPDTEIDNQTIILPTLAGDVNYSLQNSQNLLWTSPTGNTYTDINPQYTIDVDGNIIMGCIDFTDPDLLFNINDMGTRYIGDLSDFSEYYGHAIFRDATDMTGDISDIVNPYKLDLTNCSNIIGIVSETSNVMEWYLSGTSLSISDIESSIANIQTYVSGDTTNRKNGVFEWQDDVITDKTTISNILYLIQYGWDMRVRYDAYGYAVEYDTNGSIIVWNNSGGNIIYK